MRTQLRYSRQSLPHGRKWVMSLSCAFLFSLRNGRMTRIRSADPAMQGWRFHRAHGGRIFIPLDSTVNVAGTRGTFLPLWLKDHGQRSKMPTQEVFGVFEYAEAWGGNFHNIWILEKYDVLTAARNIWESPDMRVTLKDLFMVLSYVWGFSLCYTKSYQILILAHTLINVLSEYIFNIPIVYLYFFCAITLTSH